MRRGVLAQIAYAGEGILLGPNEQAPVLAQNGADGGETQVKEEEEEEEVKVNGNAGRVYVQRDVERERQTREAAHAAVFQGLDLYDPDED